MYTATTGNPFVAVTPTAPALHRLVKPFEVAGMGVNEVMVSAAILLIERGEKDALVMAQQLLGSTEELELRALLALREQLRAANSGGDR